MHATSTLGSFLDGIRSTTPGSSPSCSAPLLFNARVTRGGQTLFNATYYAGFVGLLTGMKTGGFSISVDTRFDNSFWKGLADFFKGDHSGHFVAFTTRSVMENNATYEDALKTLTTTKMIGP